MTTPTVASLLLRAACAESAGEEFALIREARALAASRWHCIVVHEDGEGYEEGTYSDLEEEENHP